jgi:hypothetical protein
MNRRLPKPADDRDRKILADVKRVGWSVMLIPEDDEGPGFAYSLGFLHSFGCPEVIVFGLPIEVGHGVINQIGRLMQDGRRFRLDVEENDVAEGYPSRFLEVGAEHYEEYLGYASWLNRTTEYPVLQCVWPDRNGRFPWEPDVQPYVRNAQPLLGPIPKSI